jgi:hypothetical protein
MVALMCFVLALLALPFKSKSRLEAENATLRHQLSSLSSARSICAAFRNLTPIITTASERIDLCIKMRRFLGLYSDPAS